MSRMEVLRLQDATGFFLERPHRCNACHLDSSWFINYHGVTRCASCTPEREPMFKPYRIHESPFALADEWNKSMHVGDFVDFHEVLDGPPVGQYRIRTPATVLNGTTAVVWLNGKAGCVSIRHCRKAVAHP